MSTNKQTPMNLEQLLNMDMGELSDWLVENAHRFTLQPKPIKVDSPEEIGIVGEEILVWDGCDWSIDYAPLRWQAFDAGLGPRGFLC